MTSDGELFVKRVQKQLNGTVAITSDGNPPEN